MNGADRHPALDARGVVCIAEVAHITRDRPARPLNPLIRFTSLYPDLLPRSRPACARAARSSAPVGAGRSGWHFGEVTVRPPLQIEDVFDATRPSEVPGALAEAHARFQPTMRDESAQQHGDGVVCMEQWLWAERETSSRRKADDSDGGASPWFVTCPYPLLYVTDPGP